MESKHFNKRTKKLLTNQINAFELKRNICLPLEYKNFITYFDGVHFNKILRMNNKNLGILSLRKIYDIETLDTFFDYNFSEEAENMSIITIGETLAPISICMGVQNNEFYGKIFLFGWDEGLIFQNNSFDEFIEGLNEVYY